jgi:hypothetical protein
MFNVIKFALDSFFKQPIAASATADLSDDDL